MPTDATGSPTPLGIPKFNTSADAPSGLGFNAAMDEIDTLITARVGKPSGIVSGEVPVWNGTGWDRSSVTKISPSGIANGIAASQLSGYPTDGTKFLAGDGTWKAASPTTYRKTTATVVNTTLAETDLLGGGITLGAAVLGTTGVARLTAVGDWLQNSGASAGGPRFKLKLGAGATVVIDTGALLPTDVNTGAARFGWKIVAEIFELGATNAQWVNFQVHLAYGLGTGGSQAFTTGEGKGVASPSTGGGVTVAEGGNSAAIDATVPMAVQLSVINSSANAAYETKLLAALVEVI